MRWGRHQVESLKNGQKRNNNNKLRQLLKILKIQVPHKAGFALHCPQRNKHGRVNYLMKQNNDLSEAIV